MRTIPISTTATRHADGDATRRHTVRYVTGPYDAVLLVSFGGPEGPDDVIPFLENVTAGRNIPRERLAVVGEQYDHFGGVSPLNEQCRRQREMLERELAERGLNLPVYWGNRNWAPYLADTVRAMTDDGVQRALAVFTSAYSSYSGCRQYRENIQSARAEVPGAPEIDKVRAFYDHPGFIEPFAAATDAAVHDLDLRTDPTIIFTAHSIPTSMAAGCDYEAQLREACRLVIERIERRLPWRLAWQSRSGPPQVPWLEPDVNDEITSLAADGVEAVVIVPIGFVSDHMEVAWGPRRPGHSNRNRTRDRHPSSNLPWHCTGSGIHRHVGGTGRGAHHCRKRPRSRSTGEPAHPWRPEGPPRRLPRRLLSCTSALIQPTPSIHPLARGHSYDLPRGCPQPRGLHG